MISIKNRFSPLTRFLIKVGFIYASWQWLYDALVLPDGRLDTWLSIAGVKLASSGLRWGGWDIESAGRIIACTGNRGVEIQNGCNGMEILGLYSGLIIAYPGNMVRRVLFLFSGIGLLFFANVFRIAFFTLSIFYFPSYWNPIHDYSSYVFFYPTVLILWYLWLYLNNPTDIFSTADLSSV